MRVISHVDGVEVVAREQAYGPHPRWTDQTVAYNGVTKLLLLDETEKFACDACGAVQDTLKSLVAHMGSHGERGPQYSVDTIKAVLRAVIRNENFHNKCERAAIELNQRGVTMLDGGRWLGEGVSRIYRTYKDKYPVRVTKIQPTSSAETTANVVDEKSHTVSRLVRDVQRHITHSDPDETVVVTTHASAPDLLKRVHAVSEELLVLGAKCATLARDIENALTSPPVDPELIEKARRFDEIQALMPGIGQPR